MYDANIFLSEKYSTVLKIFKEKGKLSLNDLRLLTNETLESSSEILSHLRKNGFIEKVYDPFRKVEEEISFDTKFFLTTKGKEYLEYEKHEKSLFRKRSIYTPIGVSILTAIITTYVLKFLFG